MKKYISFILAVLLSLCLVSCKGNQTDDGGETLTPTLIFGKNIAVYQDTVFYRDQFTREIKYQNIKNLQSTGWNLYQDPLATEGNPFKQVSAGTLIIVDPIATKKNDGAPILYMTLNSVAGKTLISFNTANNQVRVLKKDIPDTVTYFLMFDEHLIFTTNEGDLGTKIHSIKTDGTDYHTLENPDKLTLRPVNIRDGELYFTSGNGNLYKAPMSLDSYSLVLNDCASPVFFCDDDIYYNELSTSHLCKANLNDPSVKETVIDKATAGIAQDSLYLYTSRESGDTNTVYIYNAQTNETTAVYQKSGKENYRCFTDSYICFTRDDEKIILYYDIATKEEIKIPY